VKISVGDDGSNSPFHRLFTSRTVGGLDERKSRPASEGGTERGFWRYVAVVLQGIIFWERMESPGLIYGRYNLGRPALRANGDGDVERDLFTSLSLQGWRYR